MCDMENEEIKQEILTRFHLNKLCPKCQGPLEYFNEIHCERCKLYGDITQYLVFLETGMLKIRQRLGISLNQFNIMVENIPE